MAQPKPKPKRQRTRLQKIRSFVLRVTLGLFLAVVAVALVLWWMSEMRPAWYQPPVADSKPVIELAEKVEYAVLEKAQAPRPINEPWTVRVRDEQVNAWLAVRLGKWIEHHEEIDWPEQLRTPQVHFELGGETGRFNLGLGVGAPDDDDPRVVGARVTPTVDEDGMRLRVDRLVVGRIPIPGKPVEQLLSLFQDLTNDGVVDPAAAQSVLDLLTGETLIQPEFELGDGRRVRLLGLVCGDEQADATCVTLDEEDE